MRFTIREVVLLTVIAAMGLGWWRAHRNAVTWNNRANAAARALAHAKRQATWQQDGAVVLNEENRTATVYGNIGQPASPRP